MTGGAPPWPRPRRCLPQQSATAPRHSHHHPTAVATADLASIRTCAPARQQARPREPYCIHSIRISAGYERGVSRQARRRGAASRHRGPRVGPGTGPERRQQGARAGAALEARCGPHPASPLSAPAFSSPPGRGWRSCLQAPAAPRRLNQALRCTSRAGAHAVGSPSRPPRTARRAAQTPGVARPSSEARSVTTVVVSRTTIWASSTVERLVGRVGGAGRTLRRILYYYKC